jgi:glycosyltransferase involved in cell wall biosynthesis
MPRISILVPVRNGLPYITECIDSVLSQSFEDWEMIISDNGSTDGTLNFLDTLNDSRIRVFQQKDNLGIMGNLNFLFSQAATPLAHILCADDYFTNENSLDIVVNYWKTAPLEVGLVIYNNFSTSPRKINNPENGIPAIINPAQADLWFFTCGCLSNNLSSVSMRTPLVEKIGLFNENLPTAGDFEFWTRAARKVSIGLQKCQIVNIRSHEDSASSTQNTNAENYVQEITIYEKLIEELSNTYRKERLIDYFNYEFGSFHYRKAIKFALAGNIGYMKQILKTQSSILWPKWRQLLVCFPIALLNLRERFTIHRSEKIINEQLNLYNKI